MLLLPSQLTVIPWHYLTVRVISKWNEMYPDLRLAPNVHEYKTPTTEFVAVGVGYDAFNRMVVWGRRDGCEAGFEVGFKAGFEAECQKRSKGEQWIRASQVIVEEDYPVFQAAKDFLQFARHQDVHQDVHQWLRDRQLLARSDSETATALRKLLPDLEFRDAFLRLMK